MITDYITGDNVIGPIDKNKDLTKKEDFLNDKNLTKKEDFLNDKDLTKKEDFLNDKNLTKKEDFLNDKNLIKKEDSFIGPVNKLSLITNKQYNTLEDIYDNLNNGEDQYLTIMKKESIILDKKNKRRKRRIEMTDLHTEILNKYLYLFKIPKVKVIIGYFYEIGFLDFKENVITLFDILIKKFGNIKDGDINKQNINKQNINKEVDFDEIIKNKKINLN